jgi:Ca2+:H+ antiporter
MDLNFDLFLIILVILSILVVGNFLRDGKSNYLKGGLCVLVYIIIAVSTWFYPPLKKRTVGEVAWYTYYGNTA